MLSVWNRSTVVGLIFALVCVPESSTAQENKYRAAIDAYWGVFLEHCGKFLNEPSSFIAEPDRNLRDDWRWVLRYSDELQYYEFFADNEDDEIYLNAIQSSKDGTASLECSISTELTFEYDPRILFAEIETYFGARGGYEFTAEIFKFKGKEADVSKARDYYSSDFALKLTKVPELRDVTVYVSAGRIGALYFETDVPSN